MSLKGLGGDMNSRIIRKVARFTVNLCDFMNGYIGKMIGDCVPIMITEFFTIAVFSAMVITLS
jgi:hypothetical protein